MHHVFNFRNRLINEYSAFSRSFSKTAASDLSQKVEAEYERGRYWPEPLIQINPNYRRSGSVQQLFRVLKTNAIRQFGEYRTRRLVLEAWDRLHAGELQPC